MATRTARISKNPTISYLSLWFLNLHTTQPSSTWITLIITGTKFLFSWVLSFWKIIVIYRDASVSIQFLASPISRNQCFKPPLGSAPALLRRHILLRLFPLSASPQWFVQRRRSFPTHFHSKVCSSTSIFFSPNNLSCGICGFSF